MLKKNLLSLWLIVIVFSLVSLTTSISVSAFSISWTDNANNCKPANSTDLYNGQSCYPNGQVFCGLMGANVQCADLANVTTAPASNATSSTIYSGGNAAGYIVNCLATADAASPYCNNNGAYWCNADATCLNTNHRITQCNANLWSYQAAAFTCTNSCTSGFYDCNGGVDCDTQNGSACSFLPGIDGTYICSADAGGSCRSEVSGGGSAYTCTCTPQKSFFETGTNTSYSTTDPLLWGTQYSTGDLINIGNASIAEVFNVDNNGLLTTTNATVNTMRIAFNDGVGTVGLYSINTNPDGTLAGNKGSLAMDYVNGKVYVNINGGTDWNQLLDDSTALGGPTYTISTGLTDTSGTLTADISTGVAGGQTIYGGTAIGDDLSIDSTTNGTKGNILLNPYGGNVGIGTTNPTYALDVNGNVNINGGGELFNYSVDAVDSSGWFTNPFSEGVADPTFLWAGDYAALTGGHGNITDNEIACSLPSQFYKYYSDSNSMVPLNDSYYYERTGNIDNSAVWTGSKVLYFGGWIPEWNTYSNNCDITERTQGSYFNPNSLEVGLLPIISAPSPRRNHTAVWTGSDMIVFGGSTPDNSEPFEATIVYSNGGIYNEASDTWTTIYGGEYNSFYGYHVIENPHGINGPVPNERFKHSAIWTGDRMVIFGGTQDYMEIDMLINPLTALFDPLTMTWYEGSSINSPSGRINHTSVWTGDKMLIWGGKGGTTAVALGDGGMYDPIADTWTTISTLNAPSPRYNHSSVWTGEYLIVFGGYNNSTNTYLNDGGLFDPVNNIWFPIDFSPITPRSEAGAVWDGRTMFIFGGNLGNGVYANDMYRLDLSLNNNGGHIFVGGNAYVSGSVSANQFINSGGADLAENYIASDPSITAGDVVKLSAGLKLSKTFEIYDSGAVGVVSSKPGMTLSDISQIAEEDKNNLRPLALSGRVPVKVTTENGNIEVGDYLVPASKPGYAMKQCGIKSCNSGIVIGRALEEFKTTDNGDTKIVIEKLESNVAEVESTIDAIESSETLDNEIKSDVSDIAEVAESLSRTNIINSNGEGRILMFVDLGYRLTPNQEAYLKQVSFDPSILSGAKIMNQINSESPTVVDMNVTGLIKTNKISTSLITADSDKKQIEVKLSDNIGLSKFIITNSEGGYLFGVNSRGILEFGEANPSRGQTTIPAGSTELKVNAEGVNKDSIILLTLISNMNENQTLKLSSQGDGYFIVRLNSASEEDLKFNWWYSN